jgi:hypothetical protein
MGAIALVVFLLSARSTGLSDGTTNVAEQANCFIVIDRHVTQGTKGPKGRQPNERVWTIIGTCALQGRSAYNFILQAIQAYFYDEPSPSLLPGFT